MEIKGDLYRLRLRLHVGEALGIEKDSSVKLFLTTLCNIFCIIREGIFIEART